MALPADPVLIGLVAVMVLFILAVYLFFRRTVMSFSEGLREGRD